MAAQGDNLSAVGTINADLAANNRTFAIAAGLGNVTLSGALGGTQPFAAVSITSADVTAGAISLTTGGALAVTNTGSASTIVGAITGANATLTKAGAGTLSLSGTSTYTGATTITAGRLNVNGSITSSVTVTSPGILGGTGAITGSVSGTGTVAPGASPGVLTINGNFTPGGTVELEAATPYTTEGTHFDRIVVNGQVNLSAATLAFIGAGGAATPEQVVTFIANDAADLTTPATSPGNGTTVTLGGQQFTVQYNGGDGNDVVLVAAAAPGFTVVQSGGGTSVTEAGGADTFTVVLTAQPTSDVVISVVSGDLSEATVSPATLTFTSANWNAAQTVTVTGVDDALDDGDVVSQVTLAVVDASSDDTFDAVANQTVNVTTVDNDTAGFTVVQSGGSTSVTEAGGSRYVHGRPDGPAHFGRRAQRHQR